MVQISGLVSIITPAFNAADFISDAIQSVLRQTYASWEMLIVDDGSIDDTAAVVSSFNDSRIRLIQQENLGVSIARNKCLDIAQGEFITFLDADDALPPKSLESRVMLFQQDRSVDVVDGVFVVCDSTLGTHLIQRFPGYAGPLLPRLLRLDESVFRGICFMFRSSLLGRLRFCHSMTHSEDLLFLIELAALNRPKFAPVDELTYLYRTSHASAMADLYGLESGYLQLLRELRGISQLHWWHRLPVHLRIARILLATWLRKERPIRGLSAASRALLMSIPMLLR